MRNEEELVLGIARSLALQLRNRHGSFALNHNTFLYLTVKAAIALEYDQFAIDVESVAARLEDGFA